MASSTRDDCQIIDDDPLRPGNQHGSGVVVQPDGNVLVAGDTDEGGSNQLLVQRFLPSGSPDKTFGEQGVALAPLAGKVTAFFPPRMVLMIDGRIVVAGNPDLPDPPSKPVLARFLPDGTLDPTFGVGGTTAVYIGDFATLGAMAMASDGKLLVAGWTGTSPSASFVARLWN